MGDGDGTENELEKVGEDGFDWAPDNGSFLFSDFRCGWALGSWTFPSSAQKPSSQPLEMGFKLEIIVLNLFLFV